MRELILAEIKRIAAATGEPPGQNAFHTETGIPAHKWRGVYWARWGDALTDAGFAPKKWTERLDSSELLLRVAEIALAQRRVPTYSELNLLRRTDPLVPSPKTINAHFAERGGLTEALRELAISESAFAELRDFLPAPKPTSRTPSPGVVDGYVYLIKWEGRYKIGRSNDPGKALREIRAQLPTAAAIIHTIQTDDPVGIEAYWHQRFAERRLRGEWFDLSVADVKAFQRRKFQ